MVSLSCFNKDILECDQVGLVFVHCHGGISHYPEEHVIDDDVWAAGLAILSFLETRFSLSYLMTLYCK